MESLRIRLSQCLKKSREVLVDVRRGPDVTTFGKEKEREYEFRRAEPGTARKG